MPTSIVVSMRISAFLLATALAVNAQNTGIDNTDLVNSDNRTNSTTFNVAKAAKEAAADPPVVEDALLSNSTSTAKTTSKTLEEEQMETPSPSPKPDAPAPPPIQPPSSHEEHKQQPPSVPSPAPVHRQPFVASSPVATAPVALQQQKQQQEQQQHEQHQQQEQGPAEMQSSTTGDGPALITDNRSIRAMFTNTGSQKETMTAFTAVAVIAGFFL